LFLSIISTLGALLLFAIPAVGRFRVQEQNRRFASAIQQFGKDARSYVEDGAIGTPPTAKLTGDPNVDVVLRCLNDLVKTVWPIFAEMNKELGALETPDDAFKGAFTPEQLRSKYK
jgi:hypothetical protein